MSWMILINDAIFSESYIAVAKELRNQGCDIVIVTDSMHSVRKYKLSQLNAPLYIFTEFLNNNKNNLHLNENHWNVHADFDRDNYYRSIINKPKNYWSTVSGNLDAFYYMIFQKHSIKSIFYENVSNGLAYTAYRIGQQFGVKYLGLTASRLPGFSLFSSLDSQISDDIEDIIAKGEQGFTTVDSQYISDYISNIENVMPDYMKNNELNSNNFIKKIFKKRKLTSILSTIETSFKYEKFSFQVGNPLLKSFVFNFREIKRFITTKRINKFYSDKYVGKCFYLYPLHYHPESSTSILAKYYDEYNLIKNIAFSLPENEFLVVKDHLSASGYESYDFYKKIYGLPNVILVSPQENAKKLIKLSSGIFTLTSTVGYEAIILGKPVTVFGEVFYMKHPLVCRATGYSDIDRAFEFFKNNELECDEYTKTFLLAYKQLCFPFVINYNGLDAIKRQNMAKKIVHYLLRKETS